MKEFKKSIVISFFILSLINVAKSQSSISPKYSVDGFVKSLASKGDTLIVGGFFNNVGVYTGGGAIISATSDKPNLSFPKLMGSIFASTPDGSGGYYICGDFRKESEKSNIGLRIEHILADNTFEIGFSLRVEALFGVSKILFHNGILYIAGRYIDKIGGQVAGDLTAVDVKSQKVLSWIPKITRTYLGGVNYLKINKNILYFSGGFTDVGGEKRNSAAAIEINTGKIKSWNPTVGSINAIDFYNDKIIIAGGFSDAKFENHACAFVDTLNGNLVEYIFNRNNLYWAAGISHIALKGDTLFTFSGGTFDTMISATNLKNKGKYLWNKYFNMTASPTEMLISGGALIVCGNFESIYKTNLTNDDKNKERDIRGIVAISTRTGDLINWFPSPNNDVRTMSFQGKNLFVGGGFSHINSLERFSLLMINTKSDEILPFKAQIPNSTVNAIKIIDSTLYIGGDLSNVSGRTQSTSVLSFSIKNNQLLSWNVPYLGNVSAIEANEKNVFIGGSLTESTGLKRVNLLAIDRKTANLTNWSPNPNRNVLSLYIAKNTLYVGGDFTVISGQNRNYISSFDLNTLNLTTWNPNPNASISALYSSGNTIWAGGSFSKIGATNVSLFAGLDPNSGLISQKPTFIQANGKVNAIFAKGKYVMIGGDFTLNNSRTCSNFIMYDLLSNNTIPPISLCQDFSISDGFGNRIFALSMNNNNLYFAGLFLQINGKANASNLGVIQYPKDFFQPKITDYFPKSGGNGGDVSVNFYGDLIQKGMKIKLVSEGLPDIVVPDSMINLVDDYTLRVIFDLRQKNIGLYSIKINASNGVEYLIDKGFDIVNFKKPETWVQVVGPDAMRIGRPQNFVVQVGNNGNADAVGVPVFIYITGNTKVKFQVNPIDFNSKKLDSLLYISTDTLFHKPSKSKVYSILLPRLLAGSTNSLNIEITSIVGDVKVEAVINDPLFNSPMGTEDTKCLEEIAKTFIDMVVQNFAHDAFQCGYGLVQSFDKIRNYKGFGPGSFAERLDVLDLTYSIPSTLTSCASTALYFVPQTKIITATKALLDGFGTGMGFASSAVSGGKIAIACKNTFDPDPINSKSGQSSSKSSRGVQSLDPNDKIGVGINAKHYITGKEPMQYGIRFENFATATAAAQYVKVVDTLDRSKVDLSTFQLNFFNFGNRIINVSAGQKKRTELIDLRPQKNLILKVQASLNDTTGIFTTEFTSLDPRTMQLTEDAILGFLPPNKTAPEGEGGIYFTVNSKADLPNKTEIKNRAYIYFDENAVIPTPIWVNTLDKLAPDSKIEILPEITTDTTFTLRWGGKDGESGIKSYDVYYSVNNKGYKPLMLNTNNLSSKFTGKIDSTYLFYSIAVDSVKNVEIAPNTFDTKTTIAKILSTEPVPNDGFNIYPNPTKGILYIEPKIGIKINKISLFNMTGKSIETRVENLSDGKYQLSVKNIPNGVYLLYLDTKDGITIRKVVFE
jgi:hypothetical protein